MKTALKQSRPVQLGHILKADAKGQLPTEIELVRAGEWHTPWHGDFTITTDDIDEMIRHFDNGVYRVNGTEPLPGTLDHMGGNSPAAFRIKRLYRIEDIAYASVDWTKLGEEKLERDEYRYVSFEFSPRSMPFENPEKEGDWLNNVLTGATLTNDPLFKTQKPVMASARSGDNNEEGDQMNLAELLAKKIEDLTDEEKAFIAEHKDELTDEQRTAHGLEAQETDEEKAKREADEKAAQEAADAKAKEEADAKAKAEAEEQRKLEASAKSITPEQLKKLQADAKAGREAQQELLKSRLTASVTAHVTRGAMKSDQVDEAVSILMASSEKQRERLEKFLAALPSNKLIASVPSGSDDDDEQEEVQISKEELEAAEAFGNTREDIEAFKKAQAGK